MTLPISPGVATRNDGYEKLAASAIFISEMINGINVVRTAETQTAPHLPLKSNRTNVLFAGCFALYSRFMVLSYTLVILGIRLFR
jgi:hypothetical protein